MICSPPPCQAPWPALLLAGSALPAETGGEYFERRVRPLWLEHCWQCHGESLQSADPALTEPGTGPGSAGISGDESSPLIRAVRYESAIKMPPASRLPEGKIRILMDWVRKGAPWPG